MKLLIIRPEPGAGETAKRVKAAGFEPMRLPLFEVGPRPWNLPPHKYDALLLTSANAVRHAGDELQKLSQLPLHAVGARTADAALKAGLNVASTGNAGIEAVFVHAASSGHRRLLWLTGEEHTAPQPFEGINLNLVICYASKAVTLPENVTAIIAAADAVALHSPRAARHFCEVLNTLGIAKSSLFVAAFSPAIAEAAGTGWRGVAVAPQPNDAALLSALADLAKVTKMRKEME